MTTTSSRTTDPTTAAAPPTSRLGDALRTALDGRWAAVREEVRTTLDGEQFLPVPGLTTEQHRARVVEQMAALVETGRPRDGFPVAYGGRDDIGASVTAFEMLGGADLSLLVKAGVHWGLFGGAVTNLGTEHHHRTYLPRIITAELPGCFAMTETGHGSDVQSIGTTATYDHDTDELVVHTPHPGARKDYIGGAARDGRMAVVFAQLVTQDADGSPVSHGVHAVMVPIRDEEGTPYPGVTIEDCGEKAGLAGVDNGRLTFDHVRVPRTELLDRFGGVRPDGTYSSPIENETRRFFTMLGTLVRGRVSVAGGAGAATQVALSIALRYAEQRRQFAAPGSSDEVVLLDYRAHQRRLLPRLATSYALRYAQNQLVSTMHDVQSAAEVDEVGQRELESRAAGIKVVATWHATRTIQECREACGGAGYLLENRLPTLKADTDVFTTFEGDNTVLLQLVAKGLLTSYRDEFGSLDTAGMVRFVARQVAGSVAERVPGRGLAQLLSRADLRDEAVQLRLLRDREQHVLEGLARRLRAAGRPGADLFAVFNEAQDHVLRAARVHVDRVVMEAFVTGVQACTDPEARALLERVRALHGLAVVEDDLAWFLAHGRLTPGRAKEVTSLVNELCTELRPHAIALVEGFGVPEQWLGAAIVREEAGRQAAARAHAASS